jgi:hypothetical protein
LKSTWDAKASFLSHEVHRSKKSLLRHTRHCHIAGYHITNNVGSRVTCDLFCVGNQSRYFIPPPPSPHLLFASTFFVLSPWSSRFSCTDFALFFAVFELYHQ